MTAKDKRRAKAITADKYPLTTELCSCGCEMYRIVDSRGELVAMTAIKDSQGKAEFIVQACNSHEALVKACKVQLAALKDLVHNGDLDMILTPDNVERAIAVGHQTLAQVNSGHKYAPLKVG